MLGRKLDDQITMNQYCWLRQHNQAAIRRARECGDAKLNLFCVIHTDRTYLYAE